MIKPLRLEFSGFLSYKEAAVIDFEALSKSGLFGIFGSTGSGKTAVLDALTLALFGKVPRLSGKSIADLLNNESEFIFVRFDFSVGGDDYRVERKLYFGARIGRSKYRLSKLDGGAETPVADKEREVTARVEALFGFNYTDFTKAALLPQGKFAEYLAQTGSERKKMLERILNLERYGNSLSERVRSMVRDRKFDLEKTEAQLSEFDDVGEDVQKQLEADVERLELEATRLEKAEADAAVAKERTERAFLDTAALLLCEKALLESEGRERTAAEAAQRFALHEKARDMYDLYSAKISADDALDKARVAAKKARDEYDAAKADFDAFEEQSMSEREKLETQKAASDLKHATLKALEDTAALLDEKRAEHEKAYSAEKAAAERAATQEKRLKMAETEAAAQKDALEALKSDCPKETPHERIAALMDGKSAQEAAKTAQEQFEALEKAMADAAGKLRVAEAEDDAAKNATAAAARDYECAADAYDAIFAKNSAAFLAARLTDGKPCPVCGSVHHPAAAAFDEADAGDSKRVRDEKKRLYDAVSKLSMQTSSDLATAKERASEAAGKAADARQRAADSKERLIAAQTLCGVADFAEALLAVEADANKRMTATEAIESLTAKCDATAKTAETARRALADATLETSVAHERAKTLKDDAMRLASALSAADAAPVKGSKAAKTLHDAEQAAVEASQAAAAALFDVERCHTLRANGLKTLFDELTKRDGALTQSAEAEQKARAALQEALAARGFKSVAVYESSLLNDDEAKECRRLILEYADEKKRLENEAARLAKLLGDERVSAEQNEAATAAHESAKAAKTAALTALGDGRAKLEGASVRLARKAELTAVQKGQKHELSLATELEKVLKNRALVDFIAREYLKITTVMASNCLFELTNGAYGLDLSDTGEYMVAEHEKGGFLRPVDTLSGGETFLVSLSLALSLSQKSSLDGKPLGILFLDEGFGTLDDTALSSVLYALDALSKKGLTVGVISHLDAMKEYIATHITVTKTEQGSRVEVFG